MSLHLVRTWSLVIFFSGVVVFSIAIVVYDRPLGALGLAIYLASLVFVATEAFGPIAAQRPQLTRVLARIYLGGAVLVAALVVLGRT